MSPEEQQALDSGVAERDPEALRADYISALITITDLNEQQAGCVVDAISDAGFDLEEIVASGVVSDELQTATDLFIDICSS